MFAHLITASILCQLFCFSRILLVKIKKNLHLCTPGPVVQWIEYKIPVLTIWVRFPSGLQRHKCTDCCTCAFLLASIHNLLFNTHKIDLYAKQQDLSRSTYQLMIREFSAGTTSLTDIIQLERQLLDYSLKKSEAVAGYNTLIAGLEKLVSTSVNE